MNHTYFEKDMRSQLVIPEKSAMAMSQKISILSNDLVRRLSNINIEKVEEEENVRVVEHFITQLKTSGYDRKKAREIVVSGIVGWKRRRLRRAEQGQDFYRGAASTLKTRIRKKLLDPVNWFKEKAKESETPEERDKKDGKEVKKVTRKRKKEEQREVSSKKKKTEEVKTVMFCPYTVGSTLAKNLRETENDMEKITGYRLKIVEEAGEKIVDILHSSNPWKGEDCGRQGCLLCKTKEMTGKGKKQDCMKRSLVYETWCETCYRAEIDKIDEEEGDEEEKERKKKRIKMYKCIGETARSVYERGMEHLLALEKMEEDSHMMKHIAIKHSDKDIDDVKFGMRVISYTRTALERQILESVKIQEEKKKHWILNSRAEYSRCTIPRLTAKMGDKEVDKIRKEEKKIEELEEENVRTEILRRKKEKCKKRGAEIHDVVDKL